MCLAGGSPTPWGNLAPDLMGKTDLAPQKPDCLMGESLTTVQSFQSNGRENPHLNISDLMVEI